MSTASRSSSTGSTSSPSGSEKRASGGSRWGSLVPAGIVALGVLEIALLIIIGVRWSLWWSVLIVVLGWVVGVALIVAAGQQSFVRLRSVMRAVSGRGDVQEHLSRPAFTMLAAVFFFFPGLLTDIIGIILLIVPVQRRTVKAMGLGGDAERTRSVLYRRSGGGVIDGEIIVESSTSRRPASGRDGTGGPDGSGGSADSPPTITQG